MSRKCPDCKRTPLGPNVGGFRALRCLDCAVKWLAERTGPVLKEEVAE